MAASSPRVFAGRHASGKVLVAAVPLLLVACTSPAGSSLNRHPAARTSVSASPFAAQLAHGHWVKMAVPPIRLCLPFAIWDGSALIVIEAGANGPCSPAAAAYYPAANRWARIAAPPPTVGRDYLAAFGGGRLVLVSQQTGSAAAWSPASRRWLRLPRLPAAKALSMTWTGRMFLVIGAREGQATGQAWGLAGGHWQPLPSLPPVWHGWYTGAPAATIGGSVYVLAHRLRGTLKKRNISGSSRLLRLTASGWTVVPLPPAATPGWTYVLTALDGSLLATGLGCSGIECMETAGQAAIITPGARTRAIPISAPGLGIPFFLGIAAGPRAVVVTYSPGGNTLAEPAGVLNRAVEIYDPLAGRWLKGPRAPATPPGACGVRTALAECRAAFWTPYGIASLGQGGDWMLRPAGRQPAATG